MYNKLTLPTIIGGISKTLNIANQMIPLYKQAKPMIENSSKMLSNLNNIKSNINKSFKEPIVKKIPDEVIEQPITNLPTFFQ